MGMRILSLMHFSALRRHLSLQGAVASPPAFYKYWKPPGVLSTATDDEGPNIVRNGLLSPASKEIFSSHAKSYQPLVAVGRLDKASTGLLLLTDREELCAALLRTYHPDGTTLSGELPLGRTSSGAPKVYGSKYEKVYLVQTHRRTTERELAALRSGVEITTIGRRKGAEKRTRETMACRIERVTDKSIVNEASLGARNMKNMLLFYLREGRNRQIRKMLGSQGNGALVIHRLSFGGISLEGLTGPGDLLPLSAEELRRIDVEIQGDHVE